MTRLGSRVRTVLISLAVLAGVGGGIMTAAHFIIQHDKHERAQALVEFRQDLVDAGFAASMDDQSLRVEWKEEPEEVCGPNGGNCRRQDKEEIDATVIVAGCFIELERDHDTAVTDEVIQGGVRVTRFYKFDEVKVGDDPDGLDVTAEGQNRQPYDRSNPTRHQVYDYLAAHPGAFPCFTPEAPR